ncbi:tail fiber assembly protein [Burkholderia dolosa]|uniref:tail fiber assembly protein n=1 Tax=Burkholderia dolosa TaxID=152500 RepID=UPI001B90BF2F|nr:tail fiber assembly protein [Burkholderia dolosa]MBR8314648.1 tail fiber assembly protein [Burkholderia dolosa]
MMIHQYDNETGQYISSGLADVDPRNPDRWLMPAFSTSVPLPERTPLTWPFWKNGAWELRPDYRGRVLYRCDTGEKAEILVAGVSPAEQGLTDTPRPSDQYVWSDGKWVVDPAAIEREQRDAAMAEFERRMTKAQTVNKGKQDALAADLLSPLEVALFKAWAAYQMALVRSIESPEFPARVVWPDEPDALAIAERVQAEQAAKEKETQSAEPSHDASTGD